MFKVECNLPELRSTHAQNPVKIVSLIFAIVGDEGDLNANRLLAYVHFGNPYFPALKRSTHVGHRFCPEFLQIERRSHSTFQQHQVRSASIDDQAQLLSWKSHAYCYNW